MFTQYSFVCFLTTESKTPNSVPSWNNILHGEKAQPSKSAETRRTVSWISVFANCEFVIVHTLAEMNSLWQKP